MKTTMRETDSIDDSPEKNATRAGLKWRRRHRYDIDAIIARAWWALYGTGRKGALPPFEVRDTIRVKCPICGREDNDWPVRGGLCLDCFSHEWVLRYPIDTSGPGLMDALIDSL